MRRHHVASTLIGRHFNFTSFARWEEPRRGAEAATPRGKPLLRQGEPDDVWPDVSAAFDKDPAPSP